MQEGHTGPEVPQPEAASRYWRRRFVALAVGLTVFAVAAWGLSEALQVTPHLAGQVVGNSHGKGSGGQKVNGHGGTSGGGTGHGGAHAGSGQGAGESAGRGGTSPPGGSGKVHYFRGFKPAFCARGAIVLSLSATQLSYGDGQAPQFSLSVVSTQQTACSFNVGSGHLALVIKEGPARIWSSADCPQGTPSLVTALQRGVPTVVDVSWNRRTSSPGCGGPARRVPPGAYTGYAVDGSLTSAPVSFRLS